MPRPFPVFAVLCFSALSLAARAVDFTWAGKGTVRIDAADGWELQGEPVKGLGFTISGKPASAVPLVFQVTVIDLPVERPMREEELVDHLAGSLDPYVGQSVEKEVHPIALKMKQGRGWFAELTDSRLVGRAPVPNDYKILRNAIALLDPHTLVVATMQCDDPADEESGAMLRMVSSLRFERRSAGTPSVQTAPVVATPIVASAP